MKKQFILLALISMFVEVESMEKDSMDNRKITQIIKHIKKLEERKADSTDPDWQMPLVFACSITTSSQFLQYFIKKGVNLKLNEGTLLVESCDAGAINNVEILLKQSLNPNTPSLTGEIPIIQAIKNGDVEIVNLLLAFRADPNCTDAEGFTPLMHIFPGGSGFADRTCTFNIPDLDDEYNADSNNKVIGAEKAKLFASALIKAGARVDAERQGKTVFDFAIEQDMEELAEYIRDCAAKVKTTSSEKKCNTCNFEAEQLLRCSNCKKVYYCNRECQITDWKSHKSVCKKE